MENINTAMGKGSFSPQAKSGAERGTAAGIIQNVPQATGELMTEMPLAPQNVREGMAIGIKSGQKEIMDASKVLTISHRLIGTPKRRNDGQPFRGRKGQWRPHRIL